MGKLSSAARKRLPATAFGMPKSRGYPMPNKSHAANAKARASEEAGKGKLSASEEAKIDAKADKILKK